MSFFELLLKFLGYNVKNASYELAKFGRLSQKEYAEWLAVKKWEIVGYHYNHNGLYRKFIGKDLPEKWEDIPVITKKQLRLPIEGMISDELTLKDCYLSSTSGSSGTPLNFAKDKFAHALTWAIIQNRYGWLKLNFSSKQARFYGIPLKKKTYYFERVKDFLMNRYRFTIFNLSDSILEKYLQKFRSTRFDYLYGYTNSMLLFARYLIKKDIVLSKDICPSIRYCIATSEQCTDADKAVLEKAFGVPVVKEYGISESDFVAFTNEEGKWIISNEILLVEVVDENNFLVPDGQVGKLVITSLYNKAMPFIRYEVGDYGSVNRIEGTNYYELLSLDGRLNDTIYLPSGKTVPAFTLYYVSRQILEESGVISEYKITQTALDSFVFEIVSSKKLEKEDVKQITSITERYLEKGLKIEIRQVEFIKREGSGKLKHFHSLLKQA